MTYVIHPVILCGGSGTRLWPLSTPETPKQFLALTSSKSMIEETAERVQSTARSDLVFASTLVVGSRRHANLLKETLAGAEMILEPMGRNSAPAVAAATLARAPTDLILILPADHDIQDVPAFHDAIVIAAKAAEAGDIVTFGIEPTHPATGYGYIKAEAAGAQGRALAVDAFVEKPDLETAQTYLDAGSYYWNAGIFLFKACVMLDALEAFAPDVRAGTESAMADVRNGDTVLNAEAFAETPSISIDYAVMEKAKNVKTVPVSMGWSDVGGYRALHELLTETDAENYTSGPVHVQNSSGLYVRSEGPVITVNGASNLVIVATGDEVMITPKENDAAVKELGKVAQNHGHALGISPALREKARDWLWTAFDVWAEKGWDSERGGFVEQLDMGGNPDRNADRRVRVQARQVFSFAKAIELGWPRPEIARSLVEEGLKYIDARLRHIEGGFVHLFRPNGSITDDRRDLYDHAFIILAGSAAYRVIDSELGLKIAKDAIAFIETHLRDPTNGGWFESSEFETPRRANPHMHLLEAMMEYHAATGSDTALEFAGEIVRLFETKFFDPESNILAEKFNADWTRYESKGNIIWEPGHHFEWATLLHQYDEKSGHDGVSWRRRLIAKAEADGISPNTGMAINAVTAQNVWTNSGSRLWHQLERIRSHIFHPDLSPQSRIESVSHDIFQSYLSDAKPGGWIDEIDQNGDVSSDNIPGSMLYHAVTCFGVLLR